MKIHIDRITESGLHIVDVRAPEWWNNFPELLKGDGDCFAGPVNLDITLERLTNQIHATGQIVARIKAACARCLEFTVSDVLAPVDVYYVPVGPGFKIEETEEFEAFESYSGEEIDMAEYLRGQLALHYPLRFFCQPDCRGLCPHCGANLNREACNCSERAFNPRWAALKQIKF